MNRPSAETAALALRGYDMGIKNYCVTCKHENDYSTCVSCARSNSDSCLPSMYEGRMKEDVNHPDHYNAGKFECIEVMAEVFGIEDTQTFCHMNAFKYLWRCKHKGNCEKDVGKAHWYLKKSKELELIKKSKL